MQVPQNRKKTLEQLFIEMMAVNILSNFFLPFWKKKFFFSPKSVSKWASRTKTIFFNLKSNSALLFNKGHNFWKSVLTQKIPKNWIRHSLGGAVIFIFIPALYFSLLEFNALLVFSSCFLLPLLPASLLRREGKQAIKNKTDRQPEH